MFVFVFVFVRVTFSIPIAPMQGLALKKKKKYLFQFLSQICLGEVAMGDSSSTNTGERALTQR